MNRAAADTAVLIPVLGETAQIGGSASWLQGVSRNRDELQAKNPDHNAA
jgi:hypothetical protein